MRSGDPGWTTAAILGNDDSDMMIPLGDAMYGRVGVRTIDRALQKVVDTFT